MNSNGFLLCIFLENSIFIITKKTYILLNILHPINFLIYNLDCINYINASSESNKFLSFFNFLIYFIKLSSNSSTSIPNTL